jgi:hypothetical protein
MTTTHLLAVLTLVNLVSCSAPDKQCDPNEILVDDHCVSEPDECDLENCDTGTIDTSTTETGTTDSVTTDTGTSTLPNLETRPHGVGGGGATSGLSISPYNDIWFVGSDMGTLFRSPDRGYSWQPVNQLETTYSANLPDSVPVGFLSDGSTMFHAPQGLAPVRSTDAGFTWEPITITGEEDLIRYWLGDTSDPNTVYAHTSNGLAHSGDMGLNWTINAPGLGDAKGVFLDHNTAPATLYFATENGIYSTINHGQTYNTIITDSVRWFAGGQDSAGLTLTYIDSNGAACDWEHPASEQAAAACGEIWISIDSGDFNATGQEAGAQIVMAENDSQTIYAIGDRDWDRAYGTKVWRSNNAGSSWELKFHQQNWDVVPYAPWPSSLLEWSAVGLEVGWWDGGYYWFAINQLNSAEIGGSGNFFTHVSYDGGDYWTAAFTDLASTDQPAEGMEWRSTGLEVTTARRIEFHPNDPSVAYIENADIGCQVTQDSGDTWRMCNIGMNSVYDVTFDPDDSSIVYAAAGSQHDWPHEWYANYTTADGGIYESTDYGRTWIRFDGDDMHRQFLSVAYDADGDTMYAGSQESGIARKIGDGEWEWINEGLGESALIVPQIEIDAFNGDVYILLTGDKPDWSNREYTGVYKMVRGGNQWTQLRGTINHPPDASTQYELWWYPTSFAIDLSESGDRSVIWLSDLENNFQYLATGVWKSEDGGDSWNRSTQFTHPYSIDIDPNNPDRVYVSGNWNWGQGGTLFTDDGGVTWERDNDTSLQLNRISVTVDPNDPNRIYATHFGSGVWSSPRP